jgi:RNA-directed DNA polymerase
VILELLIDSTGLGRDALLRIVQSAPVRYKVYPIPKRTGGERIIAQPSRPLKALQRAVADEILSELPIHEAAAAYRTGLGIVDNARRHRTSSFILKLDFVNFFNSLLVADWDAFVRKKLKELSTEDKYILRQLLFYGAGENRPRLLSVGAPSSPTVSNLLMYEFDDRVSLHCQRLGVTYTRYADDITLSAPSIGPLLEMENALGRFLGRLRSPKLVLKREKRGLYSRAGRRMVTGLVLTPTGQVSLGRDRKREISAMIDHVRRGVDESQEHILKTKGYLGFAISCEPTFVDRLRTKYGSDVIDRILKYTPVGLKRRRNANS